MKEKYVPMICLDFDGVIHTYTGWKGNDPSAMDEPISGSQNAVREIQRLGYRVVIFTTRHRDAVLRWLERWGFPILEVTDVKPPFKVLLDDRAVQFRGEWNQEVIDGLHQFKAHWEN